MAKYRQFHVRFWDDPDIELLEPIEKLIFIYVFTNPACAESGIYPITIKNISNGTGIPMGDVKAHFEKGIKNLYYDWDSRIIFVGRFLDHNGGGRPDLLRAAIVKECKTTRTELWDLFLDYYPDYAEDLGEIIEDHKQFANGLQTVGKLFNRNRNSNSNSNRDRKRDTEKKKKTKEKRTGGTRPAPKVKTYVDKVNEYFSSGDIEICSPYWAAAYPNVDIEKEVLKAKAWLISNQSKAKKDFRGFTNNWLKSEMEKISRRGGPVDDTPQMVKQKTADIYFKIRDDAIAKGTPEKEIYDSGIFKHMQQALGIKEENLVALIDELGGPEKLSGRFPGYYKFKNLPDPHKEKGKQK
jgi:hypothetical protein